jgi:3-hydroxyacyl-CoA dehydrogenase
MMKLAKKIRKTAVVSGVCDGFIGNRMVAVYMREAMFMLEEGASVQQIDGALEKFGMAMGVFKMSDLAGNDISWAIRKRKYAEDPSMRRQPIADRICEAGRFGQKTGAGFYRYEPGRRDALRDPVVDGIVDACRKEAGITPRKIDDTEIVECRFPLTERRRQDFRGAGSRRWRRNLKLGGAKVDMDLPIKSARAKCHWLAINRDAVR